MEELSITQKTILAIFLTDTKTTKYLNKRLDLNDVAFTEAALKQRPKNRKLLDFIDAKRIHMEQLPTAEQLKSAKTEVGEVEEVAVAEECRGDIYLKDACAIFENDKGTLKRIMKGVDAGNTVLQILESARKARPKNKKIASLISKHLIFLNSDEPLDPPEPLEVKETIAITKKVEDIVDVKVELRLIFQNDKGTLKAINKHVNLSDEELLEMCLSRRPKNAKLKKLMLKIAEERESFEDNFISEEIAEVEQLDRFAEVVVENIPYVQNDMNNITMFINGEMECLNSEHPNFVKIIEHLEAEEFDKVLPLIDIRQAISKLVLNQLEFRNDSIYRDDVELDGALVDFIISMAKAGSEDIQPFMRFLNKVLLNPSKRAQTELYGFLKSGNIPINEKGNILTYKRIKTDWTDCHTGKMSNAIGKEVSMARKDVTDNSSITCASGLHVCSYSYLSSFGGGRTVICEVHPKDVVSIPNDYNNAKMRCCRYTVLKEVENNGPDVLSEKPVYFNRK